MNVFGVGAWELVAILLIMLVFAGPKRMIHWSYVLGQHVSKFRKIWSETVDLVQKEFDDAGVGIKLPKEPPTRKSLNTSVAAAMKPMTQPVQDSLNEVQKDLDSVKEVSDSLNDKKPSPAKPSKTASNAAKARKPALPKPSAPVKAPEPAAPTMGSWGGAVESANGNSADFGAWSQPDRPE